MPVRPCCARARWLAPYQADCEAQTNTLFALQALSWPEDSPSRSSASSLLPAHTERASDQPNLIAPSTAASGSGAWPAEAWVGHNAAAAARCRRLGPPTCPFPSPQAFPLSHPAMVLMRIQADSSAKLLAAILSGDRSRLTAQLASASPAALAVTEPLSVFHAAALVGGAEAVRLLAAAGAPPAAAGQLSTAGHLYEAKTLCGVALSHEQVFAIAGHVTALTVAARMEDGDTMSALLALGVAPDAGSASNRTPLAIVASGGGRSHTYEPPFGSQSAPLVQQLLAAGADVTRCAMSSIYLCARRQPAAARILLSHLRLASQAGQFEMPAGAHDAQFLLHAAGMVDDVDALEHFAARLQPQQAMPQLAQQMLCSAAATGSLQVVDLALRSAAAPDGQQLTAAGHLLGPHVEAAMPGMMHEAAYADRTALLQLLLAAGHEADNNAVRGAVTGGNISALRLLLQQCPLPDPAAPPEGPLALPSDYLFQYQCPILTALQTHHTHRGMQARCGAACHTCTAASLAAGTFGFVSMCGHSMLNRCRCAHTSLCRSASQAAQCSHGMPGSCRCWSCCWTRDIAQQGHTKMWRCWLQVWQLAGLDRCACSAVGPDPRHPRLP